MKIVKNSKDFLIQQIFVITPVRLATKFTSFQLEDGRYLLGAFAAFYAIFHIFLTFYTVKIGESGKGVPVFLSLFAVGALATTIVMIVFIAAEESG